MANMSKCRVCGKEYTPCKSAKYDPLVFNWREVACSPDCGSVYLAQVLAARNPRVDEPKKVSRKRSSARPVSTEAFVVKEASDE